MLWKMNNYFSYHSNLILLICLCDLTIKNHLIFYKIFVLNSQCKCEINNLSLLKQIFLSQAGNVRCIVIYKLLNLLILIFQKIQEHLSWGFWRRHNIKKIFSFNSIFIMNLMSIKNLWYKNSWFLVTPLADSKVSFVLGVISEHQKNWVP